MIEVTTNVLSMGLLGVILLLGLFGCKHSPEEKQLAEVRQLIQTDKKHPGLPPTNRYIPTQPSLGYNGSWRLTAGVWIEDGIYYKALGVPMGEPPKGDDVKDRHPGVPDSVFSRCGRCDRSWKWVEGHTTEYESDIGCFPLCERCWKELTPQQRLPYYRTWFDSTDSLKDDQQVWAAIQAAVLAGK